MINRQYLLQMQASQILMENAHCHMKKAVVLACKNLLCGIATTLEVINDGVVNNHLSRCLDHVQGLEMELDNLLKND